MSRKQVAVLTALAMIAFAGNSLLCRMALLHTRIDAASFTSIRLLSGALVLGAIVLSQGGKLGAAGSWTSALALFAYAAAFSFAYISLTAATGALLLVGAVQTTMISFGLWKGERFTRRQQAGLALALGGLVALLLPGLSAPPLPPAALMLAAGFSWGIYSLRGKNAANPIQTTAGNFLRALPFAAGLSIAMLSHRSLDVWGISYAVASGGLASGVGYVIWYTALRGLKTTTAATVQLSFPVIAALGGVALLGETFTLRLLLTSIAILGGIWLITVAPRGPSKVL